MKPDRPNEKWDELIQVHPEFEGVISKNSWEFIGKSDRRTVDHFKKYWGRNIRENIKNKLWKKHGGLADDCVGLGKNKAIIGVGAGQSFNLNKSVLKQLNDFDGVKPWKDRNFIIVASNHQYKPLLNMGIIPDFVILADGSEVVMTQLNEDVPKSGQHSVLLAGLHCSPKVLRRWSRQGREIRFYVPYSIEMQEIFGKITGKDPGSYSIMQGGNVLNTAWTIGLKFFHSTAFMAIGNDLSFPLCDTIEEQRELYYSDGDYSSNSKETGTGRDEAKAKKKWMGFNLKDRLTYTGDYKKRYELELDTVGTTGTLWVYKTWVEANVLGMMNVANFMYYNCSEGGIAGVMCKDDSDEGLVIEDNWFLMDEICHRWRTRRLKDAASEFLWAKEVLCRGNPFTTAPPPDAIRLAAQN